MRLPFYLRRRQGANAPLIHFDSFFSSTEICRLLSINFQSIFTIHVTRHKIDNPLIWFLFFNIWKLQQNAFCWEGEGGMERKGCQKIVTSSSSVESLLRGFFLVLSFKATESSHRRQRLKIFSKFNCGDSL